ncbi:MAG TPA: DNA-3-methyladenine glycosylase [Acholeplasmataceae bacterium]|jgi:DNA-3-methyladenine glycosylase|nr:DNA-3-methyladenine glycosylase [Acholeplasmataceae bacterium]
MNSRLAREFYVRKATEVAKDLLGKVIYRIRGEAYQRFRIVETEAYCGPEDKAAHSYGGRRTKRTEVMYREGGHLYVYFVYGMHHMLNIVANKEGIPEAVLIRAAEPLNLEADASGPGKLCRALGITLAHYGLDLCLSEEVFLVDEGFRPEGIVETTRVNIEYAEEDRFRPWRYYIENNPHVSRK